METIGSFRVNWCQQILFVKHMPFRPVEDANRTGKHCLLDRQMLSGWWTA